MRSGRRAVAGGRPPNRSASERLEALAKEAVANCKTARRHRKGLSGDNFYAAKLGQLRADATNSLLSFPDSGADGQASRSALVDSVFGPNSDPKARLASFQELSHKLKTVWRSSAIPQEDDGLFPVSIVEPTRRGYLIVIARQMNGCFTSGWHDAAAVMMRRLVEVTIIEAFEGNGIANKIKDARDNYFQLTDLVSAALTESTWTLSRNTKSALPGLRDIGHKSAHGRYFLAKREDLMAIKTDCRVVIEEFLHHAHLI